MFRLTFQESSLLCWFITSTTNEDCTTRRAMEFVDLCPDKIHPKAFYTVKIVLLCSVTIEEISSSCETRALWHTISTGAWYLLYLKCYTLQYSLWAKLFNVEYVISGGKLNLLSNFHDVVIKIDNSYSRDMQIRVDVHCIYPGMQMWELMFLKWIDSLRRWSTGVFFVKGGRGGI